MSIYVYPVCSVYPVYSVCLVYLVRLVYGMKCQAKASGHRPDLTTNHCPLIA
jgi:hypothetical protein